MQAVIGIDYSMSSPSICVHQGDSWSFANCAFHFLSSKKKYTFSDDSFHGTTHKDFLTQEERFNDIADWAISKIPDASKIFLEGYAFGAKGVVFHIGECTGVLKHKLHQRGLVAEVVPPSTIKKFATGKGNANKLLMHEFFVKDVGLHIDKHFGCKIGDSPISDIVDSYFIAKYAFSRV